MTTTPEEPLNDDDIDDRRRRRRSACGGGDADGTDGGDADGTDGGRRPTAPTATPRRDGTDGGRRRRHRRLRDARPEARARPAQRRRPDLPREGLGVARAPAPRRSRAAGRPAVARRRRPPADRDRHPDAGGPDRPGRQRAAGVGVHPRSATLAGRPLTGLVDAAQGRRALRRRRHRRPPGAAPLLAAADRAGRRPRGSSSGTRARPTPTSPRRARRGSPCTADTHDVFVFQTHGHQAVGGARRRTARGRAARSPGSSMYLPTGTPHAARAQEGASLHVTLGINQLTWRGLLRRAVEPARGRRARRAPPGRLARRPDVLAEPLGGPAARARRPAVRAGPGRRGRRRGRALPDHPADPSARRAARRARRPRPHRRHRCCAAVPGIPCVLAAGSGPTGSRCCSATGCSSVPAWLRPALEELRGRRELAPADLGDARRAVAAGPLPPPGPRGTARDRPVTQAPAFRCAAESLARGDDLAGTASTVAAYLLLEHAGSWGEDAFRDSRLPGRAGPGPEAARDQRGGAPAARAPVRTRSARPRTAFASSPPRPTHGWAETAVLPDLEAVLDLDLARPARGRRAWAGSASSGRAGATPSARTAATTPAAPSAAGRWPWRWRRSSPSAPGSAPTSAATASPATSWCCRTGSTTAGSTPSPPWRWPPRRPRAGSTSTASAGDRPWRCPSRPRRSHLRRHLGEDRLDAAVAARREPGGAMAPRPSVAVDRGRRRGVRRDRAHALARPRPR